MPTNQSTAGWTRAAATFAVMVYAGCAEAGPIPPDGVLHIDGTMTDEGVECPALRGDDGQLYTLTGDLVGASIGDVVCIEARLVEISICQQGITVEIEEISAGRCEE